MMNYQLRLGVVTARLCGQFVLIPTRAVYEVCNSMQAVPDRWAPLLQMVEHGEPTARLYAFYQRVFTNPPEEVNRTVDLVLEKLAERGFLVRGEEEAQ